MPLAWDEARQAAWRAGYEARRPAAVIPFDEAAGSALAAPLTAASDLPAFPTSAVDAWAVAGTPGDPAAGLTFDAGSPHARIDYVLTAGPVRASAAWVVPTDASDHRPVVADLVL